MSGIDAFFELVRDISDANDERNAFSMLDHYIQYDIGEEAARSLLKTDPCIQHDVPQKYKVYIAAFTEWLFHKNNETPPDWVYAERYYLDAHVFTMGVEIVCKKMKTDDFRNSIIEHSLTEFKKRNLMVRDVLSAV